MSAPIETMQHGDPGWQIKLLPFMVRSIVVMGMLFFLSSSTQLYLVYLGLRTAPEVVQPFVQAEESSRDAQALRWDGLLKLEHELLARRHQVVNAALMHQACVLHLGFLTGMLLCLVGAVFILGRLHEDASSLLGQASELKLVLHTASPGIVLVVVGSGLICVTLFTRIDLMVQGQAVYVSQWQERSQ